MMQKPLNTVTEALTKNADLLVTLIHTVQQKGFNPDSDFVLHILLYYTFT